MTNEVMAKAITDIDDKLITDAYKASHKQHRIRPLYSIGAMAACLVLILAVVFMSAPGNAEVYLYSEKVSASPCTITSPLSVASVSPRTTAQELSIPLDIELKGETRITCSDGTISVCGKTQDTIIFTGNDYLADSEAAKNTLSLVWNIENPDETKDYTLTFEGKKTEVLNLSFDENTHNWSVFIEK